MLPQPLEDWLTDEGDKVVRKMAANQLPLNPDEQLLYEFWLFDAEQRNGGVSQYFCNHGLDQWRALSRLAKPVLASFYSFAARVDEVLGGSNDPYQTIVDSAIDLDQWYAGHQVSLVTELQAAIASKA